MATLKDIIITVRELAFDRFVTPTFYIKGSEGDKIVINQESLSIRKDDNSLRSQYKFSKYPTLQDVFSQLIIDNYKVSAASSFLGTEPATSLQTKNAPISDIAAVYRKNFFSDDWLVGNVITDYMVGKTVFNLSDMAEDLTERAVQFDTFIQEIPFPWNQHISLWVAFHTIARRRLYEASAKAFEQSSYSLDDDEVGMIAAMESGSGISMSIGDVFSISEDNETQDVSDKLDSIGLDNVLGDKNSFWYRLQLWTRERYEYLFSDFTLRKNQVGQGKIILEKETNFYAYFDSNPYTVSPLSREILSSSPTV